jgi:hypothetical protein
MSRPLNAPMAGRGRRRRSRHDVHGQVHLGMQRARQPVVAGSVERPVAEDVAGLTHVGVAPPQ